MQAEKRNGGDNMISNKTISRVTLLIVLAVTLVSLLVGGVDNLITVGLLGASITMFFVDELVSYEWKERNYKC